MQESEARASVSPERADIRVTDQVEASLRRLSDPRVRTAVEVGSVVRRAMGDFLRLEGFVEIAPVIIAPLTDPLNHPVEDPRINYYGHSLQLTRSMIFHKQLATVAIPRIFCFSPNLRFEPLERRDTGRHLVEFTQLDLEMRDADREEAMDLAERLMVTVVEEVKWGCRDLLAGLGRELRSLAPPFPRHTYAEARKKVGPDFEMELSLRSDVPFWLTDIPLEEREFYDREDPQRPGILLDMDLIYPEGFGEALSGGEREHELGRILARIEKKGQSPGDFQWYLRAVQWGLPSSAGFGIGIERLVRWLCGLQTVAQTSFFPKTIGDWCL